ncbi:hypothetical protein BDV95DRAFT_492142, partial [Massariosphaeria phaeospora]
LEAAISRHFIEEYYGLLLLPNCHREFYNGWIAEIQHLMIKHKSLHYSVLANGASHLHSINASSSMQELALMYYSSALRDLSNLLAKSSHLENHNGLLMSVMLLYLHGCMGSGTYADIPRHVGAATRILTMRLLQGPLTITQPFDRLAVESVLYQIFLVTTGLWSENTPLDYAFDAHFWLAAEKLLHRSIMFPGRSNSLNSPVLGAPVSLFRLALSMKQQLQKPSGLDSAIPCHLSKEVEEWEVVVFCDLELDCLGADEEPNSRHGLYRDGSYLYIIIISLLQEQILWKQAPMDYPEMTPNGSWQLAKAFAILRSHRYDDEWKLCFIGNWPIYTLGFFASSQEQVDLVKGEIDGRWRLTNFSQLGRFISDLETVWRKRGFRVSDNT